MIFQAFVFSIQPSRVSEEDPEGILIYCHNEHSQVSAIYVEDYYPTTEVVLPVNFNGDDVDRFIKALGKRMRDHAPTRHEVKFLRRSNGVTFEDDKICVLWFKRKDHIRHCHNILSGGYLLDQRFDFSNDHRLSLEQQFLLSLNLGPVEWFTIPGHFRKIKGAEQVTSLDVEYHVSCTDLSSLPEVPTVKLTQRIMYLDIECRSFRGIFPNPLYREDFPYAIVAYVIVGDKRQGFLLNSLPNWPKGYDVPELSHLQQFHVDTPEAMIHVLCQLVKDYKVTILTGHNLVGFDLQYMFRYLACQGLLPPSVSRLRTPPPPRLKQLLSKTLGFFHIWDMSGIIVIDSMLYAQRVFTMLPSFKLSFLADKYLPEGEKMRKLDVTKDEIFAAYTDMADADTKEKLEKALALAIRVLIYCEVDVLVVSELFSKWRVLDNLAKLAEHSSSMPEDAQLGLQTPQWVSRLMYRLKERGHYSIQHPYYDPSVVAPDLEGGLVGSVDSDSESDVEDFDFEGDEVIEEVEEYGIHAKPGLYPYVWLEDYGAMYPTIIEAHNACITTVNHGPIGSLDVETNIYEYLQTVKTKTVEYVPAKKKTKPSKGTQLDIRDMFLHKQVAAKMVQKMRKKTFIKKEQKLFIREFVKKEVLEGIMPNEMSKLRRIRQDIRDHAANVLKPQLQEYKANNKGDADYDDRIKEMQGLIDNFNFEQLFVKQSTNALYGFSAGKSFLADRGVAQFITGIGRKYIMRCKKFFNDIGIDVVYGDSVAGDTPVILRLDGEIFIKRIDEIYGPWEAYGTKEAFHCDGLEIWQDGGFTAVTRLIRHEGPDSLVRVTTGAGTVDCTRDHSLLDPSGAMLTPDQVTIGTPLLHTIFPFLTQSCDTIEEKEAFVLGAFMRLGDVDDVVWSIPFYDNEFLLLLSRYAPFPTEIRHHPLRLVSRECPWDLEQLFNDHDEKCVPFEILTGNIVVAQSFWSGYNIHDNFDHLFVGAKEMVMGLVMVAEKIGFYGSVVDCDYGFRLDFGNTRPTHSVLSKRSVEYTGFVYDFETESHHFHVGPGRLVVHNTDSVFAVVPDSIPREDVKRVGCEYADQLTDLFPKPMFMEMEGVFMLFLVGSKCYVKVPVNEDGSYDYDKMEVKGLMTARRDHARFIGKFFNDTIHLVIRRHSLKEVLELVLERMELLHTNKVPHEDLAVTKKYKAGSAKGNLQTFCSTLRERGIIIQNADHVTYVIVHAPPDTPVADRMRLSDEFGKGEEVLDSMYYLESTHRVDAIINTMFSAILKLSKYTIIPKGGVCKGICHALQSGHSWEDIVEEVRSFSKEPSAN